MQPSDNGCVNSRAPFFCDYVLNYLMNDRSLGKSRDDRKQMLRTGGLTIRTSIDLRYQAAADQAVQDAVSTQISKELYAGYFYLAISAHFDRTSLLGFSKWMRAQAREEPDRIRLPARPPPAPVLKRAVAAAFAVCRPRAAQPFHTSWLPRDELPHA